MRDASCNPAQRGLATVDRRQQTAIIRASRHRNPQSLEGFGPSQPRYQRPAGTALNGQCPVHDERRKDQYVATGEIDPVTGPLAVEDLDAAALVLGGAQLDHYRYLSQAHFAFAEIHMPIVKLSLGVARQLQLTHFCRKCKFVACVVEHRDLPNAVEYPIGLGCTRNPEQIAVSDEAAVAPRHPARQYALFPMQCDNEVAFLRAEPARKEFAVMKRLPHQPSSRWVRRSGQVGRPLHETLASQFTRGMRDYQYTNYRIAIITA